MARLASANPLWHEGAPLPMRTTPTFPGPLLRYGRRLELRFARLEFPVLTPGGAWTLVVVVQIAGLLGAAALVTAGVAASAYVTVLAYAVLVAPTLLVARQIAARTLGQTEPVGPACYCGWYRFSEGEANALTLLLSASDPSVAEITDAVVTSTANSAGVRYDVREVVMFGDAARVVLCVSGNSFDLAWHRRLRERAKGATDMPLGAQLRFGGLHVADAALSSL